MRHVIVCPEYPPAPMPAGGIGTYVRNISRLLAESGDVVHVIAVLWAGAPAVTEEFCSGRLIIHRVPLNEVLDVEWNRNRRLLAEHEVNWLAWSDFPSQCFSWQAGLLAESLVASEGIDIIESQEYDAPLYYFQLRRALGLGPKAQPPCIIHLHSPTELIVRFNEWSTGEPRFLAARRMERFSIAAADARVCPSNYLARQAEALYGLDENSIAVIRLPIGDAPVLERNVDVWEQGSICYVGRLEPRKGVIEWVDAVIAVAGDYPSARFEFFGADVPYTQQSTVRQYLERSIPDRLKGSFCFRGEVCRTELQQHLARARLAAVPSRWENFPNTCVEAMCSGLPVIGSRNGGMAEMIEDERSGWLTRTSGAAGLENALRRALETPSLDLATMGRCAVKTIRELCNNDLIVQQHLEFRQRVSRLPSRRARIGSIAVSDSESASSRAAAASGLCGGVAVVVAVMDAPHLLKECLHRIQMQDRPPIEVIVVIDEGRDHEAAAAGEKARLDGCRVLDRKRRNLADFWNAGTTGASMDGNQPAAMIYMDEKDRLLPGFLAACEDVLRACSDVGLVSCWVNEMGKMSARPIPALPYQLLMAEIETPVLIRAQALQSQCPFRTSMSNGYEFWDLANAVMAAGWGAVVFPGLLSERFVGRGDVFRPDRMLMRNEMLTRIEGVVSKHALELIQLLEARGSRAESLDGIRVREKTLPKIIRPSDILRLPMPQKLHVARAALSNPRGAVQFLLWHARGAATRWTGGIGLARNK